jgi:hypothetical protein
MIKSSNDDKKCRVEMEGTKGNIFIEYGVLTAAMFDKFPDEPDLILDLIARAATKAHVNLELYMKGLF